MSSHCASPFGSPASSGDKYFFCTYFDRNYLAQGITLYRSLVKQRIRFNMWALCFDEYSHALIRALDLPGLHALSVSELEEQDPALRAAKGNRSRVEYFFTCTPCLPLFLFDRFPEIDVITYLDADLMFYSSPEPISRELGSDSILIIGHRFPERLRHFERHGIYNVGYLSFRNDRRGRDCLSWWRERCLEWCYDRPENGKFGDQKYLDDWPTRFPGVVVLKHKGAGLAPWNWMNYDIRASEDKTTVDGDVLIFYHFQGLRILTRSLFDPGVTQYESMPGNLRHHLYSAYVSSILGTETFVSGKIPGTKIISPRFFSRTYNPLTFLFRALRGQIMRIPVAGTPTENLESAR